MSNPNRFSFTLHTQLSLTSSRRYFILFDKETKRHFILEEDYGSFSTYFRSEPVYEFSKRSCKATIVSEDISFLTKGELEYLYKYLYYDFYQSKKGKVVKLQARRKFKRENKK